MIVISLGSYTALCLFVGLLFGFIVGFATAATGAEKIRRKEELAKTIKDAAQ